MICLAQLSHPRPQHPMIYLFPKCSEKCRNFVGARLHILDAVGIRYRVEKLCPGFVTLDILMQHSGP